MANISVAKSYQLLSPFFYGGCPNDGGILLDKNPQFDKLDSFFTKEQNFYNSRMYNDLAIPI